MTVASFVRFLWGQMMLKCQCPKCGHNYDLPPAMQGKRVKCATCKTVFTAPAEAPELELDDIWEAVQAPTVKPAVKPVVIVEDPAIIEARLLAAETMKKNKSRIAIGCGGVFVGLLLIGMLVSFFDDITRVQYPYRLVRSERESRTGNVMDLYSYNGPLDPVTLKGFCRDRKSRSNARIFYFIVLFDSSSFARVPTAPFTGGYELDEDAETQRHIRAIYTYNSVNGFSELWYSSGAGRVTVSDL